MNGLNDTASALANQSQAPLVVLQHLNDIIDTLDEILAGKVSGVPDPSEDSFLQIYSNGFELKDRSDFPPEFRPYYDLISKAFETMDKDDSPTQSNIAFLRNNLKHLHDKIVEVAAQTPGIYAPIATKAVPLNQSQRFERWKSFFQGTYNRFLVDSLNGKKDPFLRRKLLREAAALDEKLANVIQRLFDLMDKIDSNPKFIYEVPDFRQEFNRVLEPMGFCAEHQALVAPHEAVPWPRVGYLIHEIVYHRNYSLRNTATGEGFKKSVRFLRRVSQINLRTNELGNHQVDEKVENVFLDLAEKSVQERICYLLTPERKVSEWRYGLGNSLNPGTVRTLLYGFEHLLRPDEKDILQHFELLLRLGTPRHQMREQQRAHYFAVLERVKNILDSQLDAPLREIMIEELAHYVTTADIDAARPYAQSLAEKEIVHTMLQNLVDSLAMQGIGMSVPMNCPLTENLLTQIMGAYRRYIPNPEPDFEKRLRQANLGWIMGQDPAHKAAFDALLASVLSLEAQTTGGHEFWHAWDHERLRCTGQTAPDNEETLAGLAGIAYFSMLPRTECAEMLLSAIIYPVDERTGRDQHVYNLLTQAPGWNQPFENIPMQPAAMKKVLSTFLQQSDDRLSQMLREPLGDASILPALQTPAGSLSVSVGDKILPFSLDSQISNPTTLAL